MKKLLIIMFLVVGLSVLTGCSSLRRSATGHFEEALENIFEGMDLTSDDVEIHEVEWFSVTFEQEYDDEESYATVIVYYLNMTLEEEAIELLYYYAYVEDEDGEVDYDFYDVDFGDKSDFESFVESYEEDLEADGEVYRYRSATGSIRSGTANRALRRVLD